MTEKNRKSVTLNSVKLMHFQLSFNSLSLFTELS